MFWLITSGILAIWFIYMSTPEDEFDNNSRLFRFFRRIIFFVGDFYWLFDGWKDFFKVFPFVFGWKIKPHKISYNEIVDNALPLLRKGDIVLHRDDNYLSNIGIGGAMIHAGIVVSNNQVVEALSEGVTKHHVMEILRSDRAMILRPKFNCSNYQKAIDEAEVIANRLLGLKYDVLFNFSSELDLKIIKENSDLEFYKNSGKIRMCCTEIPYVCYSDYIDELDIYLTSSECKLATFLHLLGLRPGKKKITADMYVEANFDIIWCSKELTCSWCENLGMSDKYMKKIKEYWLKHTN